MANKDVEVFPNLADDTGLDEAAALPHAEGMNEMLLSSQTNSGQVRKRSDRNVDGGELIPQEFTPGVVELLPDGREIYVIPKTSTSRGEPPSGVSAVPKDKSSREEPSSGEFDIPKEEGSREETPSEESDIPKVETSGEETHSGDYDIPEVGTTFTDSESGIILILVY